MKLEKILSIKESDYKIPTGEDYLQITNQLEKSLGSIDLDIRDNSFYILYNWCLRGIYSDSELIGLGNRLITNMSFDLGNPNSDSVFLRSFSALVLCGVLKAEYLVENGELADRKLFLTDEIFTDWLDKTIDYFLGEKDLRGYIEDKSWAHSIAHMADLLIRFAFSARIKRDGHLKILNAIAQKIMQSAPLIYNTHEDSRIGRVIITILLRDLITVDDFKNWLQQFEVIFAKSMWNDLIDNPVDCNIRLNARANTRLFLSTIYFMILLDDKALVEMEQYTKSSLLQNKQVLLDSIKNTILKLDTEGFYKK